MVSEPQKGVIFRFFYVPLSTWGGWHRKTHKQTLLITSKNPCRRLNLVRFKLLAMMEIRSTWVGLFILIHIFSCKVKNRILGFRSHKDHFTSVINECIFRCTIVFYIMWQWLDWIQWISFLLSFLWQTTRDIRRCAKYLSKLWSKISQNWHRSRKGKSINQLHSSLHRILSSTYCLSEFSNYNDWWSLQWKGLGRIKVPEW